MSVTHCGNIKGGASIAFGDFLCMRLLVTLSNGDDWTYLYIKANNYSFHQYDTVTWNSEGQMFWHCNGRVTEFELLNVSLRIQ